MPCLRPSSERSRANASARRCSSDAFTRASRPSSEMSAIISDDGLLARVKASDEHRRADAFARDLSELGRKHGIGLTGETTLYLFDQEDYLFDYSVAPDSKLHFGGIP